MEVVTATHSGPGSTGSPGGPFQRHNVEEWQRLDRFTGVLETARRESGSWRNDQQQYGKVVDSCSLVSADGSAAQRQLRQLEVFQSRSPGASLQVIRAHTHTSTSSSNRWGHAATIAGTAAKGEEFENLQLALNPLDLSSQKTKASVGRSGSIGGRRPPSRPRSLTSDLEVTARLQKVSRLCQQLHEETVHTATNLHENLTKRTSSTADEDDLSLRNPYDRPYAKFEERPSILERQNGDGSVSSDHFESSEPLRNGRIEDWRQSRLNTALRGNNVDLEALDQILKSISSSTTSSSYSDKVSLSDDLLKDEPEKDSSKNLKKRHSFITAESLQEVRGRLRRLSSPVDELYQHTFEPPKEEEIDDGIVAEDTSMMKKEDTMPASNNGVSRVRSYVYGMEAMLHNKKPIIGTGSLESRSSNKSNGSSVNRSEDWYNRRKSYGFEQVHNQQIDHSNSISLRSKNKIESSTDSGICRSTEIVVIPSVFKSQSDSNKVTSYSKVGNSTVINLGGDANKNTGTITEYPTNNTPSKDNELFNVWNRRSIVTKEDSSSKKDLEQITITIPIVSEEPTSQNGRRMYHRQISDGTSVSVESNWSNVKQNSPEIKRHSIAVDETKYDNKYSYPQLRRTSLALEPSKPDEKYDLQDDDNLNNFGKKHKKVEFCKTEVHFAAESGRVNIVETDEKPPPTQNFRRRRRNSNVTNNHVPEDFNKNGLPLIHFGDTSYEKKLFGVSDSEVPQNDVTETYNKEVKPYNVQSEAVLCNNVTVSAVSVRNNTVRDYEQENIEFDNPPRGILKNRMIKPRPYILGDDNNELLNQNPSNIEDPESTIWGVRLRPVHKEENPQIWRSTVTVQNTSYNIPPVETISSTYEENPKPEFQKLLNSLRPSRKSEPSITSPENTIERSSPILDLRRSSWSVADRVKQVEDMKQTEIKGYSTRVNFGGGEATVVENGDLMKKEERHPTWPRQEETHIKDFPSSKSSLQPPQKKPDPLITSRFDKNTVSEAKVSSVSLRCNERRSSTNSSLDSPQSERKPISNIRKYDIARTSNSNGYLSSPSLVGKSYNNTQKSVIQPRSDDSKFISERSAFNKVTSSKDSPSFRRKNVARKSVSSNNQTYTKSVVKNNYYNEISSSNPPKKVTDKPRYQGNHNKPDLLQFSDNREYVNLTTVIKEENNTKKESSKRPESPIYENIDDVINNLQQMEKESTMLQELTKAADQILQAVNGYTDEDSNKVSTDSEDESRKHRLNFKKTSESLSTISETKSWKQHTQTKVSSNVKNPKNRVKPTSSTSSIESIKESKPVPPVRMNRATKLSEAKKKITGSNTELSKATKARRLQRASSREALLQSHGSSSEDIASNIDIRKPRLVRRSKTQTQTAAEEITTKKSAQSSVSRRTQSDVRKSAERVPVVGLQEIRHKTAVSTIKSTAEKNACREKALKAKEELKKKTTAKSTSISRGLTSSSSYIRPSSREAALASRSSSLTMKKFNKSEIVTKY